MLVERSIAYLKLDINPHYHSITISDDYRFRGAIKSDKKGNYSFKTIVNIKRRDYWNCRHAAKRFWHAGAPLLAMIDWG